MDIVSHGLWAGAAVGAIALTRPVPSRHVAAAIALGVLPDLLQLIPVLPWILARDRPFPLLHAFIAAAPGPDPAMPGIVATASHHLHCIMHSAIIVGAVTLAAWRWRPMLLVPLAGWWLHIALDIPTHSRDYYPVPFLYPLSSWGVNGVAWPTPWLLAANYAALAIAYAALLAFRAGASARRTFPNGNAGVIGASATQAQDGMATGAGRGPARGRERRSPCPPSIP